MWSLIFFDILTMYILCVSQMVNEQFNKMLCILLILITTAISGFQYGIGADYWNYVEMYYSSYIDSVIPYPEITFRFFSEVLRNQGFLAQSIFLLYSVIINFFLYLTFKEYFGSYKNIILAYSFYVFCVFPGFYESLVTIRAMAAVSIILYASKFLNNYKIKYAALIIVAGFFHTAAFMAMTLLLLPRIKQKKYLFIPIIFGAAWNITGIGNSILSLDVGNYSAHVAAYQDIAGGGSLSLRIIYDVMLIIMVIVISDSVNMNHHISIPLEFLACGMAFHIAFVDMGALITRFFQPFYIFILLAVPNVILQKKYLYRNLITLAFIFMITHILFIMNFDNINPIVFDLNFVLLE